MAYLPNPPVLIFRLTKNEDPDEDEDLRRFLRGAK